MPPRRPSPGRSLQDRFPAVAATWDVEANGGLTAADVAAQSAFEAHWRCPAGHVWVEKIGQRVSLSAWKDGNPAACRLCTGHQVAAVFACGHEVVVDAWKATLTDQPCPDCRQAEYGRKQQAYQSNREQILAECRQEAARIADELWALRGYSALPERMHRRARSQLTGAITYSLVGVRSFGAAFPSPKLDAALRDLDLALARVSAPAASSGTVELLGKQWWAPALGAACAAAAPEPETIAELERVVGSVVDTREQEHAFPFEEAGDTTRLTTWVMTQALKDWAFSRGFRAYRELSVPLDAGDGRTEGRLDLTVLRPGLPDLVIEIDSQNVPRSLAKLELACERGALTVWVRWNGGPVVPVPGVSVINATGRVRAAAA